MRALAAFIMSGRAAAMLAVAVFAVMSILFPPLVYLSTAGIALVTLRRGAAEAVIVVAGALAGTAVFSFLAVGNGLPALGFLLFFWGPACVLGLVLRRTVSLPLTLEAAALLAVIFLVVVRLAGPDPSGWREILDPVMRPAFEEAGIGAQAGGLEAVLDLAARLMAGAAAATFVLSQTLGLLIARWWQAVLYNPGGFRGEFHGLRLDRRVGFIALAAVAAAVAGPGLAAAWALDIVLITVVLFLFQGLAVVHGLAGMLKALMGWLIAVYVLMVFALPQMVVLLAAVGLTDTWINFRARLARG